MKGTTVSANVGSRLASHNLEKVCLPHIAKGSPTTNVEGIWSDLFCHRFALAVSLNTPPSLGVKGSPAFSSAEVWWQLHNSFTIFQSSPCFFPHHSSSHRSNLLLFQHLNEGNQVRLNVLGKFSLVAGSLVLVAMDRGDLALDHVICHVLQLHPSAALQIL